MNKKTIKDIDEFRRFAKQNAEIGHYYGVFARAMKSADYFDRHRRKLSRMSSLNRQFEEKLSQTLQKVCEEHSQRLPEKESFQFLIEASQVAGTIQDGALQPEILSLARQSTDPLQKTQAGIECARLAVEKKDFSKALSLYQELLPAASPSCPNLEEGYLEWFDLLSQRYRYQEILKSCTEFAEKHPDHSLARKLLLKSAEVWHHHKDFDDALDMVARLTEGKAQDDIYYEALLLKGIILLEQDKLREAKAVLDTVSQTTSSEEIRGRALFSIGYCSVLEGDSKAAKEIFEEFLRKFPENPKTESARAFLEHLKTR